MRLSTANSFDASVYSLTQQATTLNDAQNQLTTMKRVNKASDDPAAAARAERALASQNRVDTSQRAVDASRTAMTQVDAAMTDAGSLLQQAREALVASGNASYTDAERKAIGEKLRTIRDQLLVVSNRTDGAGSFLFGGQGATTPPFVDAPGGVRFVSTAGTAKTQQDTALPLSVDGKAAWMSARTGNGVFQTAPAPGVTAAWIDSGRVIDPTQLTGADYTVQFNVTAGVTTYDVLNNGNPTAIAAVPYTSGNEIVVDGMSVTVSGKPANGDQFTITPSASTLSVFDVLDKAVAGLTTTGRTTSQIAQGTADGLRDVDSVMSSLQTAQSASGEVLNRIDSETDRLATQKLNAQTERSGAEDLDMVSALSNVKNKQTSYSAALQSYSMVQRLSLFQYLNT